MTIPIYTKDPHATEKFGIDWSERLGEDSISSSSWIVPSGINEESSGTLGQIAAITISGGTAGHSYTLTNRIVTSAGETLDQSIKIAVIQK